MKKGCSLSALINRIASSAKIVSDHHLRDKMFAVFVQIVLVSAFELVGVVIGNEVEADP